MTTLAEKLDLFFPEPSNFQPPPRQYGTLHLLRRDILTARCIDAGSGQPLNGPPALWLATMGVLAGVDLLGKFAAGADEIGGVGDRFRTFLTTYGGLSADEAETIYQLRNSLLHSFGLYSTGRGGRVYRFVVGGGTVLVTPDANDVYRVSIVALDAVFERAVREYERLVRAGTDDLPTRFEAMFARYGSIYVG